MATVEAIKPTKTPTHVEDDWVVMDDVPVWKEHTYSDPNLFDEPLEFRKAQLEAVIKQNNDRIEDTGDFCPIVIRHTKDDASHDPPVVGVAGPFKLGKIGNKNPKWAILAKFRFHKEDAERVKRYPRVSVEYWATKSDPLKGYFDPISLLGAETPELDLGLRYQGRGRHQVLRYAKMCDEPVRYDAMGATPTTAGGSNGYVPGMTGEDDAEHEQNALEYSKEPSEMALSEEDIKQLIQAFTPVIQEEVHQAMADVLGKAEGDEMPPEEEVEAGPETGEVPPEVEEPTPGTEEEPPPMAAEKKKPEDESASVPYRKLQNETESLKLQFAKTQKENELLKTRLASLESDRRTAIRYAKIVERIEELNLAVDAKDELENTLSYNEDQFKLYFEKQLPKMNRVPDGEIRLKRPERMAVSGNGGGEDMQTRVKYAKQAGKLLREKKAATMEEALAIVRKDAGAEHIAG